LRICGRAITDTLTELLVDTVHRIGTKADRRVSEALLDDLKRVTGKTNLLFGLADASLTTRDGLVRDVVFPVVGEETLRDLVKERKATGPVFYNTLRDSIRSSYRSHYRQIFPALKALEFRSNTAMYQPIIQGLETVKRYADTKLRYYPSDEQIPLDFSTTRPSVQGSIVSSKTRPLVSGLQSGILATNFLPHFVLAVLDAAKPCLKFIHSSRRFHTSRVYRPFMTIFVHK
jgi:hypothetical protein